jgi:surface polysaccharide O-acyltransferase-like enzyme
VHPVFLNFFYKFIDVSLYDYPFVPGLIVFYLLTLVGAVVLSFLLRLIPPMKKYVL